MAYTQKATLSLDGDLWRHFRAACITRRLVGSSEINIMMEAKLKEWGVVIPEAERPAPKKSKAAEARKGRST